MSKRTQKKTQVVLDLTTRTNEVISTTVKHQVRAHYTRDGAFYDPFTEQTFADMCAGTVFAHIVPKVEQNILSRHQEISDNPGNIVPTTQPIHSHMELHHRAPAFTLFYAQDAGNGYDEYLVRFAAHVTSAHELSRYLRNGQRVVIHRSSRVFWDIHASVFVRCQKALVDQTPQATLDNLLHELLVHHIAFPTVQKLLNKRKKQPCKTVEDQPPFNKLPSNYPSLVQQVLGKRSFQFQTSWFVGYTGAPFCSIDVLNWSKKKCMLEFISKDDFPSDQLEHYADLLKSYKGHVSSANKGLVYMITLKDFLRHVSGPDLQLLNEEDAMSEADTGNVLPSEYLIRRSPPQVSLNTGRQLSPFAWAKGEASQKQKASQCQPPPSQGKPSSQGAAQDTQGAGSSQDPMEPLAKRARHNPISELATGFSKAQTEWEKPSTRRKPVSRVPIANAAVLPRQLQNAPTHFFSDFLGSLYLHV